MSQPLVFFCKTCLLDIFLLQEDKFKDEIVPVTITSKKGETIVNEDEEFKKAKFEKMKTVR
jgi:hypothetical protein